MQKIVDLKPQGRKLPKTWKKGKFSARNFFSLYKFFIFQLKILMTQINYGKKEVKNECFKIYYRFIYKNYI